MWPWEHLAFGYIVYSLAVHALARRRPTAAESVAVAAGSLLPDVIDKPLAWWFQVLPAGRTLAHSLFFAVPVMAIGFALAVSRGRPAAGVAFVVAYLAHLSTDVIYPALLDGDMYFGFLFWPVVPAAMDQEPTGFAHVMELFGKLLTHVNSSAGGTYIALEIALMSGFLLLWLADGAPGVRRF